MFLKTVVAMMGNVGERETDSMSWKLFNGSVKVASTIYGRVPTSDIWSANCNSASRFHKRKRGGIILDWERALLTGERLEPNGPTRLHNEYRQPIYTEHQRD